MIRRFVALLAILPALAFGQSAPLNPAQVAQRGQARSIVPNSLQSVAGKTILCNGSSSSAAPSACTAIPSLNMGSARTVFTAANTNEPIQLISSTTKNSQLISFSIEQELNHTSTQSWDDFGQTTEVFIPAANSQIFNGQEVAVYGSFNHFGTGRLAYGVGGAFEAFNQGSSSGGNLVGLRSDVTNGGPPAGTPQQTPTNNGALESAKGFYTYVRNESSGNITTGTGVYIDTPVIKGNGGITNDYGLIINDQNKGTSRNYAIKTGVGLVSFGDIMGLPPYTVSSLASAHPCARALTGYVARVSDAASPIWNGTLRGGGSISIAVYCNGSNWVAL